MEGDLQVRIARVEADLRALTSDQSEEHRRLNAELRSLQNSRDGATSELLARFERELRSTSSSVETVRKFDLMPNLQYLYLRLRSAQFFASLCTLITFSVSRSMEI